MASNTYRAVSRSGRRGWSCSGSAWPIRYLAKRTLTAHWLAGPRSCRPTNGWPPVQSAMWS
jgi:hypothetical protein